MCLKTKMESMLENGLLPRLPWKIQSFHDDRQERIGYILGIEFNESADTVTITFSGKLKDCYVPNLEYSIDTFSNLLQQSEQRQFALLEFVRSAKNTLDTMYVETNVSRITPSDISRGFRDKYKGRTVFLFRIQESYLPTIKDVYFVLK